MMQEEEPTRDRAFMKLVTPVKDWLGDWPLNYLGLPILDQTMVNILFDCVYEMPSVQDLSAEKDSLENRQFATETIAAVKKETVKRFLLMVEYMTQYNHFYRVEQKQEAYAHFCMMYNFETNSEGTDRWMGRILAIKDLYHLGWRDLKKVMKLLQILK